MSGSGDGPSVPLGALAALGVLAAVVWAERQKTASQRAADIPDEVALHQSALTAVKQARAQILLARTHAEALRRCSVDFDVQAKLASAFTEDLPPQVVPQSGKSNQQRMLFMIDGQERLPALKDAVDQLLPTSSEGDEPTTARTVLRQAIDSEGGLWTADKALALLDQRGWHSGSERRLNVVGNTLAVMARDGEIKRAGRGMYTSNRQPASSEAEHEVAPGVFAREASTGVWIITGLDASSEIPEAGDAA
jgi:hypothetical protein